VRRNDVHPLIAALVLAAISHRNPFQYVEPPKPKPKAVVERPAVSPPEPEPRRAESPPLHVEAPPPPEFPYHLIGRFGRTGDPIAAFSGKGQVITVQNGDTIDDTFVVRSIGADFVEIGYVTRSETLRVQLDGWI
jgi:hypothetical protein